MKIFLITPAEKVRNLITPAGKGGKFNNPSGRKLNELQKFLPNIRKLFFAKKFLQRTISKSSFLLLRLIKIKGSNIEHSFN